VPLLTGPLYVDTTTNWILSLSYHKHQHIKTASEDAA